MKNLKKTGTTRAGVEYEIVEHLGILDILKNGMTIEVNRISYIGRKPQLDIRIWSCDAEGKRVMRSGISLTDSQVEELKKIIWG